MPFSLTPSPPPTSPDPNGFGGERGPRLPRRTRPSSALGPRGRLVAGVLLGAVAIGIGVVVQQPDDAGSAAAEPDVAPAAIGAPGPALLDSCTDRSWRMHRLGAATLGEIARTLSTYAARPADVPRSEPVAPAAGVDARVRLVRPDSYVATDPLNEAVRVQVPGIPGIATAEPPPSATAAVVDDYETAHRASTLAVADARRTARGTRSAVLALAHRRSEGSDVTGCLMAVARDAGSRPVSALLVSDFGDTGLALPDGSRREFVGDLSRVHLTVVPVCTGADPGRCDERYAAFLDRARGFGLDERNVTRLGTGELDEAADTWLRTGLALVDPTTTP